MSIQLTVMSLDFDSSGTPITKTYHKNEITLGRYPENDVVLDKPEVSGVHAKLRIQGGKNGDEPVLYIMDLGSSNGTLVENNSLSAQVEIEMHPNERIIIGNYLIKPTVFKGPIDDTGVFSTVQETEEEEILDDLGEPIDVTNEGVFARPQIGSFEHLVQEPELVPEHRGFSAQSEAEEAIEESLTKEGLFAPDEFVHDIEVDPFDFDSVPQEQEEAPAYSKAIADYSDISEADDASFEAEAVTVKLDGFDVLNINFDAVELFELGGTITHKGNPLSGVEIDGGSLGTAITDSEGRYRFTGIPEGTPYRLSARKPGFLLACSTDAGEVRQNSSVPFTATQLFSIRGSVAHRGTPLEGVKVDGGNLGRTVTDSEGRFEFSDVPEFTHYRIHVSKDGYVFDEGKGAGQVSSRDEELGFTAKKLLTISGRVTHKGTPLEGVEVDGGELGRTITGPDGVYRFTDVPEGAEYRIVARKERFRFGHRE